MGTPKTKKQYVAKLSLTKAAKTLKREEAFKKKPKVMKVVRAAVRCVRTQWQDEVDTLTTRSNKHMRESCANRHRAVDLEGEVSMLRKKLEAVKHAKGMALAECSVLKQENQKLQEKLSRWTLFWGWVEGHARPGTLNWLTRLWAKGPRAATYESWGGGEP